MQPGSTDWEGNFIAAIEAKLGQLAEAAVSQITVWFDESEIRANKSIAPGLNPLAEAKRPR